MENFDQILVQVWREACGDLEIAKSCANIAVLLRQHMPLEEIIIRELDIPKQAIYTAATAGENTDDNRMGISSRFDLKSSEEILSLAQEGKIGRKTNQPSVNAFLSAFIPDSPESDWMFGWLKRNGQPLGMLILMAKPGETFSAKHEEMMQILLEPFSIALQNDIKLKEINALKEAAEADKKSLLRKLSRESLSDTIVGSNRGLSQVLERVRLVAPSDAPVMILGETGTGKELISREIHRNSPRAQGPFIRVNCGSIPPDLIDSQLFGHEKGSFTGAVARHQGVFERANGGTLFLDEIGELPLAGQVRLLRILQDGWLERVGGGQPIHVDVRVVIATHRDLSEMVRKGAFREDLWYRISVFPILLPSLRERITDIPELAVHFAKRAAIRFNLAEQLPSREDIALLSKYPWPGNVRELNSVIDRAAILGDGKGLQIKTALGWTDRPEKTESKDIRIQNSIGESSSTVLDDVVREHIERVLRQTRGRIEGESGAAKLLQIHPNTLRARMRKLGVDWTRFK